MYGEVSLLIPSMGKKLSLDNLALKWFCSHLTFCSCNFPSDHWRHSGVGRFRWACPSSYKLTSRCKVRCLRHAACIPGSISPGTLLVLGAKESCPPPKHTCLFLVLIRNYFLFSSPLPHEPSDSKCLPGTVLRGLAAYPKSSHQKGCNRLRLIHSFPVN